VAPDAGRILLRNVYGWFERTQPGTYRLTGLGEAALRASFGGAVPKPEDQPPAPWTVAGRTERQPLDAKGDELTG
jgi:hypothetical protein